MKFIKDWAASPYCYSPYFYLGECTCGRGRGFTVTPVFERVKQIQLQAISHQFEKNTSYPVTVAVQNLTENETQDFDVQLVQATTSNNGHIDYTPSSKNGGCVGFPQRFS